MDQPIKEKKGFFDLNIFGLKLSPVWGLVVGLVLTVLFNGSLLGSIGAVIFLIGTIKLISDFMKNRKSKKTK